MKPTLQTDHPGTEQLSAFVAHALPAHEHELTVAHLTKCSHCRSIVFQLQDISLGTTTENVPASSPVSRLKNWKWMVPSAAALAVVAIGIFVLRRPAELPQRPDATSPAEVASASPPHAVYPSSPVDKITPSPLPSRAHLNHKRALFPKSSGSASALNGKEQALSNNGSLDRPINGRDVPKLIPLMPNSSTSEGSTSESGRQPGGIAGGAVAGMITSITPASGPSLPAGSFAVSSATNGTRTLALDRQGNLFLTDNGGRRWHSLTHYWGGKVITVTFSGVPARTIPGAHHGSGTSHGRFEITTDTGIVWLSSHGIHWTKKTP